MSRILAIQNRQRVRSINTPLLRRLTLAVLREHLAIAHHELALHLVDDVEMARINETFLGHTGSTDVITFDHSEVGEFNTNASNQQKPGLPRPLHGEIYISIPDAIAQAKAFRTTWPSELARYVIHGLLHLVGHDDLAPAARRQMKREENRLVNQVGRTISFTQLERPSAASRTRAKRKRTKATRWPRQAVVRSNSAWKPGRKA